MPATALLLSGLAPALEEAARAAAAEICPAALVCRDPSALTGTDFAVLRLLPAETEEVPALAIGTITFLCPIPAASTAADVRALLRAGWRGLELALENASYEGTLRSLGRRMAHDLRTPLGSALTLGQLLQEITPAAQTDVQGFLASIVRSAERLRELIDKMSFFAKSAIDPLELTPVALGEVVPTVQARVALLAQRKSARISGPPSWPSVLGNAPALETLWRHLLTNALEHGGDAPQIELDWRAEPNGWIRCFVRDRGAGLGEQRIYPFERLHAVTNTRGLGLSVVRRIVDQHGGSCAVADRPEGGAEISFTLRAA
ncbi:MAG: HAMP domain-containing histidine kinase [Verrucomicrobia bacterium]|nr:HAMP domain-containing histidine kinase [Verrucomicrobiota bacterium]